MISLLRGIIAEKSIGKIVLDVHGVGYGVTVPLSTYYRLPDSGSETELKIYTHMKEGGIELVGFLTEDERKIFILLLGVSGVGPKAAANILSNISTQEFISAVSSGELRTKKIPGIGPKLASRLVTELRDKALSIQLEDKLPMKKGDLEDIVSALQNLGYTKNEIDGQIIRIEEIAGKEIGIEIALRETLKVMKKE
ncbi:Holliday junction branch migration protein RuvA [Desulfobacterota bacterium AH_259_B03_O07]|nr:Holliday junction branch migration protein RuvA [Desulfobacterota bacterium AH_259_B03_O07]